MSSSASTLVLMEYASRWPFRFAFTSATSFIGIMWLGVPVFARLGLDMEFSRLELALMGAFYAIAMTSVVRGLRWRDPNARGNAAHG